MKLAIVTRDTVGARMAGPGIRAWHMAEELSKMFDVTLVAVEGEPIDNAGRFRRASFGTAGGENALAEADVLVGQPVRGLNPRSDQRVVYDLFAPVFLELRHLTGARRPRLLLRRFMENRRLRGALARADLLVVATPAQQSLYEEMAARWALELDPDRIVTMPFGVENEDPPQGDAQDRELFLWNGGVWPWLDAETAVRAIHQPRSRELRLKLQFLGADRPGQSGAIASAGGVDDDSVEWRSGWVPYRERWRFLRKARGVVMLHHESDEASYSIRTRFFDALWCAIPVIATRGGWVSELIERHSLGAIVEPGDLDGVASAMELLSTSDEYHSRSVANLEKLREELRWERVVAPLGAAISNNAG